MSCKYTSGQELSIGAKVGGSLRDGESRSPCPSKFPSNSEKRIDLSSNFLETLLNIADNPKLQDAIRWDSKGLQIGINPGCFVAQVLSHDQQGTSKFESFSRRLNRWGFRRSLNREFPGDFLVFENQHFQRDKPQLLAHLSTRKKSRSSTTSGHATTTRCSADASGAVICTGAFPHVDIGNLPQDNIGSMVQEALLLGTVTGQQSSVLPSTVASIISGQDQ